MRPPHGYEVEPGIAWRLKKSLYGVKQSGKLLNQLLINLKFKPFEEESCL
jgi:hypothetical protein